MRTIAIYCPTFPNRLSGWKPWPNEFAPVGRSPGVRRRCIRIWISFSRGVCLPERKTILYKWGAGGGKTSCGKYRQRFGKSHGETRLHADGHCAHSRGRKPGKQHNTRNNCENREKHTLQGKKKMGRDTSAKKDCRVFCGEMRCIRSPSGGVVQWSTCFRKMSGRLRIRNIQHRLHTGFFRSTGPQSACGPAWFSKGWGFLRGNRRKRADNSRKHRHRRGACLHLDSRHRRRAHNTHKNIQQSSIEFRGRRNPRTCWRASGRIRRLSQPTSPPNFSTSGSASKRVHTNRSVSVRMSAKPTFEQESHRLHRESLGESFHRRRRRRRIRPLRGPTPQQTMEKPRRKPGSVSGTRRQTARAHFCWLVRPYKDRKNCGDPCTPNRSKRARRRKVGEIYLVGSGRLRFSGLSNISGRHPGRRRRRSGDRPATLLHERQKRSYNTRRVQKTNTAPPKRGRPVYASTTNRQNCVGMAGQKMPRNRQSFFEIQAPRNTRNRRTAQNIRTFDKKTEKKLLQSFGTPAQSRSGNERNGKEKKNSEKKRRKIQKQEKRKLPTCESTPRRRKK